LNNPRRCLGTIIRVATQLGSRLPSLLNYRDNAAMESFFARLKVESIYAEDINNQEDSGAGTYFSTAGSVFVHVG